MHWAWRVQAPHDNLLQAAGFSTALDMLAPLLFLPQENS